MDIKVEFKSLPLSRTNSVSGTADPRTSTTLILFEEFVPFEYRQQLASAGATRRRLPSLFSSANKSKQWKPAPTLNGRPYVVGAVPHSPSFREAEFEGLLRSNGSATKVISLNRSPEKQRAATTPSAVATPGHEPATNPLIKITSASAKPQFLTPLRTDSPTPTPRASPRDETSSPVPKKSHRFRLPTGLPSSPSPGKRAGLVPTEYDPVEFDTRIASFDEGELATASKHNRRRSKDDAWVDILVATNSRRMAGQDAEMRNGLKGGRSDPELASQEVSEVLAAVRGRFSDDEDESMEPVAGPNTGDTSTLPDSVLDQDRQTEADSLRYGDDEEEEEEPPKTTPRKRMGYFDLHPDRRPPTVADDPRDRFERPSYESDTSTENPYTAATVRTRPTLAVREDSLLYRQSAASEYESDPEPIQAGSQAIPRDIKKTLPSAPNAPLKDAPALPSKSGASKTASLIEMYRERERQSQSSPIPSSRLPVRQASLHPGGPRERSISPSPSPKPPAAVDLPEIDEPAADDDKVSVEDIQIDLPTRYVHGAPLHNVLEEPEEEEA